MTDLTDLMQTSNKRRHQPGERAGMTKVWNTVAVVFGLIMVFPIYWMFISTIETGKDLLSITPHFFPTSFTLSNYDSVFKDQFFFEDLRNTAVITLSSVLLGLFVGFLGAIGVARFRFRGRNVFIIAMMFVQMVPLLAITIPLYFVANDAGLVDQLLGVILIYLVTTVPYCVWVLRAFIVNIPVELDEAAMVDGCTRVGAFVRIILPLTVPGLITAGVYIWIQTWNEFILANTVLSSNDKQTSLVWLEGFSSNPLHGANYGEQMSGAFLISIPIIVLFVIFQKKVTAGLTAGSVKG